MNLYIDKLRKMGLFIQDLENNISYPNAMWNEMGYTAEDMKNEGFLDLIHPDDFERITKSMETFHNNTESMKRTVFRLKDKKGSWRWILSTSLGMEADENGEIKKYVGFDHDITEQIEAKEKAERALKEAEILRSAGEIITSHIDLSDTIKAIFEEAEKVFSFTTATVQLLKKGELEIVGETGNKDGSSLVGLCIPITENIPNNLVINFKIPLLVNEDLLKTYPGYQNFYSYEVKSWMGVPLVNNNQIIGIMVFNHIDVNKFNEDDLRLAKIFANYVAIAMENSRLYEATKELSITDPLTGCYTRRHLYSSLEREISLADRYDRPLSIIIFDIDNFKMLNDTYGHLFGDEVLKEIVKTTMETIRKTDTLCRFGGEEFVVVLPSSDLKESFTAAERIRLAISSKKSIPGSNKHVTVSLGCSTYKSSDKSEVGHILSRADQALYLSKENGRNQTSSIE